MKKCSPVDSPSTGKKISFAGRSAVAGKSEKKTQRRIDSSRFFIPPPMTVKEETSDGLTSTTEQTPKMRQQEETKLILSPNLTIDHRRSMTNQTPNQDGHRLGVSAHQPRSFRFTRESDSLESRIAVFGSFQLPRLYKSAHKTPINWPR